MRDPVVIGGGPAGAAAALALRRAGHGVTLLERALAPGHKVCGDFLGPTAIRSLDTLGLSAALLGAQEIAALRIIRRGAVAESAVPFRAAALPRRTLDAALLRRCELAGVRVLRGWAATVQSAGTGDLMIEAEGHEPIVTGTVFLATGRPATGVAPPGPTRPPYAAIKTYVRIAPRERTAIAGVVELVSLPAGFVALLPVQDDMVSVCLVTRRLGWLDDPAAALDALAEASPHLRRRLAGAEALLPAPLVLPRIPFGHIHRPHASDDDAVYRLGDQAAVLASLIADGVSVALRSGTRAVAAWTSGAGASAFHRRLRGILWPRGRLVAGYDPTAEQDRGPGAGLSIRWSQLIA